MEYVQEIPQQASLLRGFGATLYIPVISIAIALAMCFASMFRQGRVMEELGGKISGHQDLTPVKDAINLSMILAVAYMGLFGVMILLLGFLFANGTISFFAATTHLFLFGVVTLPFGLWSKVVEKKFRAMEVTAADPSVAETFQRWLVQWNEARLKLPDD